MSRDEFLKRIPAMVIEHNIHGIDIDRRCTQIAAFLSGSGLREAGRKLRFCCQPTENLKEQYRMCGANAGRSYHFWKSMRHP
jgi:hypothetical protein